MYDRQLAYNLHNAVCPSLFSLQLQHFGRLTVPNICSIYIVTTSFGFIRWGHRSRFRFQSKLVDDDIELLSLNLIYHPTPSTFLLLTFKHIVHLQKMKSISILQPLIVLSKINVYRHYCFIMYKVLALSKQFPYEMCALLTHIYINQPRSIILNDRGEAAKVQFVRFPQFDRFSILQGLTHSRIKAAGSQPSYTSYMSQNFHLFHLSNLSILNFRFRFFVAHLNGITTRALSAPTHLYRVPWLK